MQMENQRIRKIASDCNEHVASLLGFWAWRRAVRRAPKAHTLFQRDYSFASAFSVLVYLGLENSDYKEEP